MSQKSSAPAARYNSAAKAPAERVVRDIRRRTRKHHSAEEKIRIVLEGLRGEDSIAFVLDCHVWSNNSARVTARNVSASTVDLSTAPLAVRVTKRRVA